MTDMDLLRALGEVGDDLILTVGAPRKRRRPGMVLLAAALSALLLAGCVAVALSLRDRVIGQENHPPFRQPLATEVTQDVISLYGYRDSPSRKATQEWYEFEKDYDPEGKLLNEDADIPENLQISYNCYTQEMADKASEIAEKYHLRLLGTLATVQRENGDLLWKALNIPGVTRLDAPAEIDFVGGYCYPEGAFRADVDITLTGPDALWKDTVWTSVFYTQKENFDPRYTTIDPRMYEEWTYPTASGPEVLIAMSDYGGWIFAEQKDAWMTVSLNTEALLNYGKSRPSREAMEQLADVFDFTVTPQAPEDLDAIRDQLDAFTEPEPAPTVPKEQAESYGAFLQNFNRWLNGSYYALADLDGDGNEELLLGFGDGSITMTKTIRDGVVTDFDAQNLPDSLNFLPISDFPLGDSTIGKISREASLALTEEEILALYAQPIRDNLEGQGLHYTHYLVEDITGDGIPELMAGHSDAYFSDLFTIENGKIRTVSYWNAMTLCENHILWDFEEPPTVRHSNQYYAFGDGTLLLLENLEENKGQYTRDGQEITKEEYEAAMAAYTPVPMTLLPIEDYPMP